MKNISLDNFLGYKGLCSAHVLSRRSVEVITPDGERYEVLCRIGAYGDEDTCKFYLKVLEYIFDDNLHHERETMISSIMRDGMSLGLEIIGILPRKQDDRARLGSRIRELREAKQISIEELAQKSGILPNNLSRIEAGKYSVSLDILSQIASALDMKIDFVEQ